MWEASGGTEIRGKDKRLPAVNVFPCKYVAVSELNAMERQLA